MRGNGRRVTKQVVIQSMSYGEMLELYPEAKGKAGTGKIPRDLNFYKETGRSYLQTEEAYGDLTEVAHYYDIQNKVYIVFIGTSCTIIKDLRKKKYPFVRNGKPYIPNIHLMCWPSKDGFWNHGIGDMLYKLCVMSRRMLNLGTGQAEDNVYPITLVNVPNQQASKFFNNLISAHEMRAQGKKGFVAMEYDPNSPNSSQVSANQLLTQGDFSSWGAIFDRLDLEIQRLGINLNDIEAGSNVTATQIMLEEESSNALVKQIGEYNASEYKFAVDLTIDMMKKFIKKNNDTPVHLTTKVKVEGQEVPMESITLGAVADELRKHDYFVKINSRTGAIPSNTMQQAQISRLLAVTQPGTPAFVKLQTQLAQLNDRDLGSEEFAPPAPEMPTGSPDDVSGGSKPIPSETDRLAINPNNDEMTAAF